jgi:dihydropteroate synthase
VGVLTVISYSLSISEDELDKAKVIADNLKYKFVEDPIGQFIVSVDSGKITVKLIKDEVVLKEFEGDSAVKVHYKIIAAGLLNDISHAIYLGRTLQKAEDSLKYSLPFSQE